MAHFPHFFGTERIQIEQQAPVPMTRRKNSRRPNTGNPRAHGTTPPAVEVYVFGSSTHPLRVFVWRINRWVSSNQPGNGSPGWVWWFDAAIKRHKEKTCLFCAFVHVHSQNNIKNGAIFVNIDGLRPCLSKPSYGASQWALMVRLMCAPNAKETAQIASEIALLENRAFFLVIWVV